MAHRHRYKSARADGKYGVSTFVEICSCGFERLVYCGSYRVKALTPWMRSRDLLDRIVEMVIEEWPR